MRRVLLIGFVLVLVMSCIDDSEYDIDRIHANPVLAVPVAYGSLTIRDFLNKTDSSYIKVDSDDLVYLEYSNVLSSRNIRDLFHLPDKSINQSLKIPAGTIPPHPNDIRLDSVVEVFDLGLSPEKLNFIDFKSGKISYSATLVPPSGLGYEILLTADQLISKSTGKPLYVVTSSSGSLSLSDYKVNLTDNKFNLKMVLIIRGASQPVTVGNNASVSVNFGMSQMDFNFIEGFFGDQTVHPAPETLTISAFGGSLYNAQISFAKPTITMEVVNDYGVPCRVSFSTIEAQKGNSSMPFVLNPASPINISYPLVVSAPSAVTAVDVTNAKDIIDFAPTQIYYDVSARINAGISSGTNFLADTSRLDVKMNVQVPLFGHASGILLRDTAKLELDKVEGTEIQSATMTVDVVNELPLDAKIQLYLADEKSHVIDSLFDTSQTALVKASTVTASGDLQDPGVLTDSLVLNVDKLNKLFTSKQILIKAVLNTARTSSGKTQDVKFKSKYTMKVNLGLLANVKLDIHP